MSYTTFAQSLHDLNLIKDQGLKEVILGHLEFSRFGRLDDEQFLSLARRARELKLKVIFEWDILMTENIFAILAPRLPQFLSHIDSLRLQDPGALEWCFRHTDKPLQFIAENGNHNLEALRGWCEHTHGRLERLILSIELPKAQIEEYVRELPVECELLGLGRILLFYTPRFLLSPLVEERVSYNQNLTAMGESEESPHKGFPIVENRHGTFMFHIKDFCVMEFAQELFQAGLAFLRIDLRWSDFALLKYLADFQQMKASYSQELMRGFYHVNKTDVLFPKLKNIRLQNRQGDYIGEVIEAEKGSHLAIQVKNPRGLSRSDVLRFVHPKGHELTATIFSLRNLALEEVERIECQKTALIQFVSGVWVKSHVFYTSHGTSDFNP